MGRNEVRFDLVAKGDKQVERALDNVGDAAQDAGKSFDDMAKDAGHLDKKIGELSKSHKDLIRQFDSTGDVDLLKSIKKTKRELRVFENLSKELGSGDTTKLGADAGAKFGAGFVTSATSAISTGGPLLIGGLLAAAVAVSPLIGGAIGAGVLGAVGAGGLIGGIAAAANDPRVGAAAEDFLTAAMAEATAAGEPFIEPLVGVLDFAKASIQDLGDELAPAVGELSEELEPLADGFAEMINELVPGLIAAMQAARPILEVIAEELPELGEALSDALEVMAEDPDGAAMALRDVLKLAEMSVRQFGLVVAILSQTYESMTAVGDAARSTLATVSEFAGPAGALLANLMGTVDDTGAAFDVADGNAVLFRRHLDDVAQSSDEAKAEIEGMKKAINELFGIQMGFDEATLRWHDSLADLRKELNSGKEDLSLFTEEGRTNRNAILDQISAAEDLRRATAEQTGDLPAANAEFQKHIDKIRDMGLAAGFSKDQLDELLGPYRNGPQEAIIEFKTPGLLAAIARVAALKKLVGSTVGAVNVGDPNAPGRASGGPVYNGQMYLVGEQGPELIRMNGSGQVYTANQTASMLAGASAGSGTVGGRPQVAVNFLPSGNAAFDALLQALWPYILKQVRVDGGDLSAFGASN